MPKHKITSAILCEYCRVETLGKFTVLGVYSGDVVVEAFPAAFPLAAYFEISDIPDGNHIVEIEFKAGSLLHKLRAQIDAQGKYGAFPIPTSVCEFSGPGKIELKFRLDEKRWETLISRTVMSAPMGETASAGTVE